MRDLTALQQQIGERLRALREQYHLPQATVAAFLGVRLRTYCGYEDGRLLIPTNHCVKLVRLYGVSMDYLLTLTDRR